MKSLERRFVSLQSKHPELSSFTNFAVAVKGQKFSKETIYRWFRKLVDEVDYKKSDKRAILKHLVSISYPEETIKQG